jgi:hypothetical protein
MNPSFDDPRCTQAQIDTMDAERADYAGDKECARELWRRASAGFAAVAWDTDGASLPNTRGDLASAAVWALYRARDYDEAHALAERFIEAGTISASGVTELRRAIQKCEETCK